MSDYTPTTADMRANYVRDLTRNFDSYTVGRSLASEQEFYGDQFDRWIAAHDAEVIAAFVNANKEALDDSPFRTEPEYEYGASPHISPSRVRAIQDEPFDVSLFRSRPSISHGDWVPDTLVYRTKAGPWEPVPDTNERNET